MKKNNEIVVIKSAIGNVPASKQEDQVWNNVQGIIPIKKEQSFDDMFFLYEESFIIGGIVDRIVTIASSRWKFPENMDSESQRILNTIDKEYAFRSLIITGNVFFEKIKNLDGSLNSLERFITTEVRIAKISDSNGNSYIEYRQCADGILQKNPFSKEDVVHIKLTSNRSRYYGDSKIYKARQQVILLGLIDKFYAKMFEKGMLKTTILADKLGKLTKAQLEAIQVALEDLAKGIDNSFATIILPSDVVNIGSFDKETTAEEFLKYREALIESIAQALNIPVDILVPAKASRNTKAESLEEFNRDIIVPLQNKFLESIKVQLQEIKGIEDLEIERVDTKNLKNEMEIFTGYTKSGVMTANEVRKKIGLEERSDGDSLIVSKMNDAQQTDTQIQKIEEEIQKMYAKK